MFHERIYRRIMRNFILIITGKLLTKRLIVTSEVHGVYMALNYYASGLITIRIKSLIQSNDELSYIYKFQDNSLLEVLYVCIHAIEIGSG